MPKKLKRAQNFILIFILLLLFTNTASANMLIPAFQTIIAQFSVNPDLIFLPDALFVLATAIFGIIWGFYSDRMNRGKIIAGGAIISIVGFVLTSMCQDFPSLIIARIVTGIGQGASIPTSLSILMDIVPSKDRNSWFAFLAIFSSISNGAGNAITLFFAPLNIFGMSWRFSFLLMIIFSLCSLILLLFVKIPAMGSLEDELIRISKYTEAKYRYRITPKDFFGLLKKKTNLSLMISTFFAIVPGTLFIFLIQLTLSDSTRGVMRLLPDEIRSEVVGIVSALIGAGYLVGNAVLSFIADKNYAKDRSSRARISFIALAIAIPCIILMVMQLVPLDAGFIAAQSYPSPIPESEISNYLMSTLLSIFSTYPQYILFLILALVGSLCAAAPVASKNAISTDINLPEHKGTTLSLIDSIERVGKSLTLLLIPWLTTIFGNLKNLLIFGTLFYIPSTILWYFVRKRIVSELNEKDLVLKERAQSSLIDYVFDLETSLDEAIQIVEEAKSLIFTNPKKAEVSLDEGITIFKEIITQSQNNNIMDIEKRAYELMSQALVFKSDLLSASVGKSVFKKPSIEQLNNLSQKIETLWTKSEYGDEVILYEQAYLKICEARVISEFNPLNAVSLLDTAIENYTNILGYCKDKIGDAACKDLTTKEQHFTKRIEQLLMLSQRAKENTEHLRAQIITELEDVYQRGISKEDLNKIAHLNVEYKVNMKEILIETFGEETQKYYDRLTRKIEKSFMRFDKWQSKVYKKTHT